MNPKKDIFSTSEGKWDFTIALIVITIFSVFIYQFLFKTSEEVSVQSPIESNATLVTSDSTHIEDQVPQYLYSNSDTYYAKTIPVEDAYESEINTAVVISDIKNSTPIVTDSITKPIAEEKETISPEETQIPAVDSNSTIIVEEKKQKPAVTYKFEEIPKTETVQPTETLKNEASTTSDDTLNCIAIVGVFKEVNNKKAVIEKLKALGYNHSDGILRDRLHYVGVPVSCNSEREMQKLLSELNKAFGIDSWIKKI